MLVLAHVSDLHFDGGRRTVKRAGRVMKYLNGLPGRVDAVLVTGDIADRGRPDEYQQARAILDTDIPVLCLPGNHDDRSEYRTHFLNEEGSGPINRAHMIGDAIVAMCDSSAPGHPGGLLADETIAWLRAVLEDAPPAAPILIAAHHPPQKLFTPIVDRILLDDTDPLEDIIRGDSRIVGMFCGHAHTSAVTTFAGVPLVVAPSVSSVLGPEWEGDGRSHDPVVDYDAPPAIAFHVIDDDHRLTTHFRSIAKTNSAHGFRRSAQPTLPT